MMNHIFRSLELRLTLLVTFCSALVLCVVAMISYVGINQILIIQQDRALTDRIERLETLLQDSENINQIVARPKLYQNMLGNQDNLFILMDHNQRLIDINPLNIPLPKLATSSSIQFTDLTQTEHPTRLSWKTINIHQKPYVLIAGKQWSERLNILEPFRNGLLISVSIGVVLIFILSALASHFGLSTLRKLQQQTQAINVHQLQQRIQLDQAPSEIEQLTADINTMLNRIEIGYQQLNRFSEDIAHEFRTPLNNLIGQTEIMLMGERTDEQYKELLYSNLEDYQRLKRMIDSMLFLARADRQMVMLNKQWVDLPNLVETICDIFEHQAEEQACQFLLQLEQTQIFADPELLQRALYNLISNALTHGGLQRQIYIGSRNNKKNEPSSTTSLYVITSDTSIANEHLDSLFERFYQCISSRHQSSQTGGLGLSIVASIMTLHQGEYLAYNTPDGICFELIFPNDCDQ